MRNTCIFVSALLVLATIGLTGCVTVKIRYSDFETVTRQMSIHYSSSDHVLLNHVKQLFNKLYDRRLLVRLIGVRFSNLVSGNYQISLFDDTADMISLYQAIDSIKSQFGWQYLMRGSPDRVGTGVGC